MLKVCDGMKGFCKQWYDLPKDVYYFRTVQNTIYFAEEPYDICRMADFFNQDYVKIKTIFHPTESWLYRNMLGYRIWCNDKIHLDFDSNLFINCNHSKQKAANV